MPRPSKQTAAPVTVRGPKYRKTEVSMWIDEAFCSLSAPPPNAQSLWINLLTGTRTTTFPGLVIAREAVLASDLKWPIEGFRKAFAELVRKGLVEADETAGVILLRKALFNGPNQDRLSVRETAKPESPNVLKSWAKSWSDVPDSELKSKYLMMLGAFAEALGEAYGVAYREGWAKALAKASSKGTPHPSPYPSPNPSSNQDQDQEQDQKEDPAVVSLPKARQKREPSSEALTVAERLRDLLLEAKPDHGIGTKPQQVRAWALELDTMHKQDRRPWASMVPMLEWVFRSQAGDFRFVVESVKALREKYDRIATKMRGQGVAGFVQQQLSRDFGDDYSDVVSEASS